MREYSHLYRAAPGRSWRLAPMAHLVAIMAVALAAVVLLVVLHGSDTAFAEDYVACPTKPPQPTKNGDATKTASPTGTPCKATSTPTPTDTPTPTPAVVIVGGVAEQVDPSDLPVETTGSSDGNPGLLVSVLAGLSAGGVALGGAAWYVRRRRPR